MLEELCRISPNRLALALLYVEMIDGTVIEQLWRFVLLNTCAKHIGLILISNTVDLNTWLGKRLDLPLYA